MEVVRSIAANAALDAGGARPWTPDLIESMRDLAERHPVVQLRRTAVVRAADLDARVQRRGGAGPVRVWLVLEALQVTGSFKVRGALAALEARKREGHTRVIAASAGNHGAGIAHVAGCLGIQATIVVPTGASRVKCERMTAAGAELVRHGVSYDEAEEHARDLATRSCIPFISPYDDLLVLAGNGISLGLDAVRAFGGIPEIVLAPFGGGGLATGLAWAFADDGGEQLGEVERVWGVQSEVSPTMARSLEAGAAIERFVPDRPSLAEGLEGGISAPAFARARQAVSGVVVVSEASIRRAMAYAHRELGLFIEGSAACALAPVLEGLPYEVTDPTPGPSDLAVVLTGRNVDRERWEGAVLAS